MNAAALNMLGAGRTTDLDPDYNEILCSQLIMQHEEDEDENEEAADEQEEEAEEKELEDYEASCAACLYGRQIPLGCPLC